MVNYDNKLESDDTYTSLKYSKLKLKIMATFNATNCVITNYLNTGYTCYRLILLQVKLKGHIHLLIHSNISTNCYPCIMQCNYFKTPFMYLMYVGSVFWKTCNEWVCSIYKSMSTTSSLLSKSTNTCI